MEMTFFRASARIERNMEFDDDVLVLLQLFPRSCPLLC
jgi:hypothetical protein